METILEFFKLILSNDPFFELAFFLLLVVFFSLAIILLGLRVFLKFLDKDDKTIGDYECENKDENKCYVAYLTSENKTDLPVYLDEKESPLQRRSQIYNNKYVFVQDGDIINLYNMIDKKKESSYKTIKVGSTKEGIVAFTDEKDKYGVLSISDEIKELAKAKYDYIDIYNSDNTFIAKEGSSYYLIKDDNKISKDFSNEISAFNDKFLVSDNVLYDLNGNKVINKEYDTILLDKDFVFGINSRKMTIYDNNLNKLNEEEIKLKSLDYKTSYIFDEKKAMRPIKFIEKFCRQSKGEWAGKNIKLKLFQQITKD